MDITRVNPRTLLVLAGCAAVAQAMAADPTPEASTEVGTKIDPSTATLILVPLTSGDSGTLAVGLGIFGGCLPPRSPIYGYISTRTSGNFGSYSPTGLTGGKTVANVYDVQAGSCVSAYSDVTISGFSANPGSSWLTSITCNGVQNLGTAGSFSYSAGDASWTWSTPFGLSTKIGQNVTCTIIHN